MQSHCINTGEKQGQVKFIPHLDSVSDQLIRENAGRYQTDNSSRKLECLQEGLTYTFVFGLTLHCSSIKLLGIVLWHICLTTSAWIGRCILVLLKKERYENMQCITGLAPEITEQNVSYSILLLTTVNGFFTES